MHWQGKLAVVSVAAISVVAGTPAWSQVPHVIASPDQVTAIRAGRLFDSRSGAMLSNQVILIKGDRVTDVGASVQIPAARK